MTYAPIYIITLNRDIHFKRCVESLKQNSWAKYTDVYIGLDFPQNEKYRKGWEQICDYLDKGDFSNFKSFTVLRQERNIGAIKNSIYTIEHIVQKGYNRWIYAEDDIEFAPNFLEYMDKTMSYYENDPDVFAVTGYSYPIEWKISQNATCVKQNFNVAMWGTGFWLDKFMEAKEYIEKGTLLLHLDMVIKKGLYKNMLYIAQREYIPQALRYEKGQDNKMRHLMDVTARIYLAVAGKYCIMPVLSKTRNHGFDGSGLYCPNEGKSHRFSSQIIDSSFSFDVIPNTPNNMRENLELLNSFENTSRKDRLFVKILILSLKVLGTSIVKKICHVYLSLYTFF